VEKLPQEAIFLFSWKISACSALAGIVNGLLGAGGGMLLVPMLTASQEFEEQEIFPSSVSMILPLCLVSLAITGAQSGLPWSEALPYLLGSIPGGLLAGILGKRIRLTWLHRGFGLMILWGGIRYLW
jgi:uncharacterized membrane protein YfcA